jgi:hypothetical protein
LSYVGIWFQPYAADIFTSAGNAVLAHQLENSDPTEQMIKGRGACCYLIPVGTKHGTHEYPQNVAIYADVMSIQHV